MECGNQMINIVYEDNHLLVIEKPINVPVQADSSGDVDLLTMLKNYIKDKYGKKGNVYLGLVHRLDRPVGGIMVFAKTSKCAKRLSKQIIEHKFEKYYYAVCEGKVPKSGKFLDKLVKDRKKNISYVSSSGKESILFYDLVSYKDGFSLVKINLKTGRSHQIRVQFSSRGFPLYGDLKYNVNCKKGQIALFAYKIKFFHPITKDLFEFSLDIPDRYPFNNFKSDLL